MQNVARDPKSAAGHYYLGMNLGQLARTKLLGALKLVDEMEREFKAAVALDERFDHADRNAAWACYTTKRRFSAAWAVGRRRENISNARRNSHLVPPRQPRSISPKLT